MEITEVRIKLMEDSDDRLRAFCSITLDDAFVIRDLKIIEGANGPFVAMPSRKLTSHCPQCGCKNHLRAAYCNQCGLRLKEDRALRDQDGRTKLYADIAHPINSACREMLQERVILDFEAEIQDSKLPGYVSKYDDDYDDDYEVPPAETEPEASSRKSHVEQAETGPRGPHRSQSATPASRKQTTTPARSGDKRQHENPPDEDPSDGNRPDGNRPDENRPDGGGDEFGAGIF